mgnify:CR=1 FL=1
MNRGEECDDGNTVNGDGCSSACKRETVSPAVPLAVGIPLGAAAVIGLIVAKCAMGAGSAASQGQAYVAAQPGQIL